MAQIVDDSSDPFPQLGIVYRKVSGGSHVKQWKKKTVGSITANSAQYGKIAAEGKGLQNFAPSAWGRPKLMQKLGMQNSGGNSRKFPNVDSKTSSRCGHESPPQQNNYMNQGWHLTTQVGSSQLNDGEDRKAKNELSNCQAGVIDDDDKSVIVDDDDELLIASSDDDDIFDDDSDLVTSEKSHGVYKKSKSFKAFFDSMDELTVEEINSPERKWHCPACKGGPGAIDWYRGLDPLMFHAMTKKSRRVKLHRVFAEVLDEETQRRGISLAPVGVAFDRWEGLNEKVKDYEIVWPPMIVIMNTRYEQEENGKWIGMGNQELLDQFKSYAALKARHSYGPQGHRGMGVLIFDYSAAGYLEAARLHKHFEDQGRDRNAWNRNRVAFCSGGKRQLFGYMASKEDMNNFNQHSQGRSKLKFEMRSYQEMVGTQIKQINDNTQQVIKYKDQITKEKRHSQVLSESISRLSEKLRKTMDNDCNLRERAKLLLEVTKEEMDCQEQFFKDQIQIIHQTIDAKEDNFEKVQKAKWEKIEQLNANLSTIKDAHRMEDIANFISIQDKEMEEFEAERNKLIKSHEDKRASVMKRYWKELLELEKELENELTQLMEKFNKDHPEAQT